jgi:hypothetical protein
VLFEASRDVGCQADVAARSTVIASQLDPDDWHAYLAEPTVADAVLDRLVHNAYTMKLIGPSRRKEKAEKTTDRQPIDARVASLRSRWCGLGDHDAVEQPITMRWNH